VAHMQLALGWRVAERLSLSEPMHNITQRAWVIDLMQ
jgi:hypothetical protein